MVWFLSLNEQAVNSCCYELDNKVDAKVDTNKERTIRAYPMLIIHNFEYHIDGSFNMVVRKFKMALDIHKPSCE